MEENVNSTTFKIWDQSLLIAFYQKSQLPSIIKSIALPTAGPSKKWPSLVSKTATAVFAKMLDNSESYTYHSWLHSVLCMELRTRKYNNGQWELLVITLMQELQTSVMYYLILLLFLRLLWCYTVSEKKMLSLEINSSPYWIIELFQWTHSENWSYN